ncbi:MAG: hypothetical protein AB202_02080 [Parcubacteria bacterium C7867-007]|nr:MAG: hypothetical protein AB202_02080 [Parcubacteria bacterium C7867-007]
MNPRNTTLLALSAVAAAVFALVPIIGIMYNGATAQLLEMFGEAMGWEWLDHRHPHSLAVAWVIFTLIFFFALKLWLKFGKREDPLVRLFREAGGEKRQ